MSNIFLDKTGSPKKLQKSVKYIYLEKSGDPTYIYISRINSWVKNISQKSSSLNIYIWKNQLIYIYIYRKICLENTLVSKNLSQKHSRSNIYISENQLTKNMYLKKQLVQYIYLEKQVVLSSIWGTQGSGRQDIGVSMHLTLLSPHPTWHWPYTHTWPCFNCSKFSPH